MTNDLTQRDLVDIVSGYLEIAFRELDGANRPEHLRACLRRMAQYLLDLYEPE